MTYFFSQAQKSKFINLSSAQRPIRNAQLAAKPLEDRNLVGPVTPPSPPQKFRKIFGTATPLVA
jgi:hypothetical protein